MTAAQEPVVVGEQNALPVTEPLEMAFYSGAWAFRFWMHDRYGLTVRRIFWAVGDCRT